MLLTTILNAAVIFFLRFLDVGIATLRTTVMVRGFVRLAAVLSFFECLVWLAATARVLSELDNPWNILAFAAGFACGTFTGVTLAERLALGKVILRVVTPVDTPEVAPALRAEGALVTQVNAEGRDGSVRMAFSVVPRKRVNDLIRAANGVNPRAFITIEETRVNQENTPIRVAPFSRHDLVRTIRPRA